MSKKPGGPMFKSYEEQYAKLLYAVKENWPDISDEDFFNTKADIQLVINLISEQKGLPPEEVLRKLRKSVKHEESEPIIGSPS